MFYHNHRRYIAGKRKGKTPIEILTGKKQDKDWTELLFEIVDQKWRGLGVLPVSGLRIRERFARFDAARRFGVAGVEVDEPEICISGEVLRGLKKPGECPAFGAECKPEHPLGATMVSSEGACAAYYKYQPLT